MSKTELVAVSAPGDIEARSFAIIDREVAEPKPFAGEAWEIVRRMIHTTADFEMQRLAKFSTGAIVAGKAALAAGSAVLTDTEMARCGVPVRRMVPLGCEVRCLMNDPDVGERALKSGTTRARAAVDVAVERGLVAGSVLVVGNAPTALIRLFERLDEGAAPPALVVGMPVGFVNAAESKELLMARDDVQWISLSGRKGGSALAACVVNQLAEFVLRQRA